MLTRKTLQVVDVALGRYHDYLLFALDLHDFPKGHVIRKNTADMLWNTRKAQIELGLYRVKIASIVLPPGSECS